LMYFKIADLDTRSGGNALFVLLGVASLAAIALLLNYLRKRSVTSYASEFPPRIENDFFNDPDHPV
jgi:hypothetical protein